MRIYSTDHFVLPLPPGHRFPMAKYALLRARGVPVAVAMAGGYAETVDDIADIHLATVALALERYAQGRLLEFAAKPRVQPVLHARQT